MRTKTLLIFVIAILIPTAVAAAIAMAAGGQHSVSPSQEKLLPNQMFTYQGELTGDDGPEVGPCDFQFGLWDDLALGSQVGVTQTLTSVPLYDGRFTVQLNEAQQFGIDPFDGSTRYLAVAVDCSSGTGSYVSLTPRQPLTPAPYSYYASDSGSVPWTGITGMPDGFADGVDDDTQYDAGKGLELISTTFQLLDDYQLPQSCDPDQLVEWNGSSWDCVGPPSNGSPDYGYVIVVAKSGGAFDTIQGALDSIGDASPDNRYLVWVAPGVYSETVDMIPYVDIEGAGRNLTKITSLGNPTVWEATLQAAEHSQLRSLTVENTGGDSQATAIQSEADDFSIQGVTAVASGGSSSQRGIHLVSGNMLNRIEDTLVELNIDGSSSLNYGIHFHANDGPIDLILDNVTVNVAGSGNSYAFGIRHSVNTGRTGTITATNVGVRVENLGSSGSSGAYAVYTAGAGARLALRSSFVYANAPGQLGAGLCAENGSSISARNISSAGNSLGVCASASSYPPSQVHIDSSQIRGGDYSVRAIGTMTNTINIGATLLEGSYDVTAPSTLTCVASYDESYNNVNGYTSCP